MKFHDQPRVQLKFKNLPLIKAVVRVGFKDHYPLNLNTIFAFHERLRAQFPVLNDLRQFESAPGVPLEPSKFVDAMRHGASLIDPTRALSITLQNQLVALTWERTLIEKFPEYPRFPAMLKLLWEIVELLGGMLQTKLPPVHATNMGYVNFVQANGDGFNILDYLSEPSHIAILGDAKSIQSQTAAWRESDEIDLRFEINQATAQMGERNVDGYSLMTAGGIILQDGNDPPAMLGRVHDRMQQFFEALISERAKRDWGMEAQR